MDWCIAIIIVFIIIILLREYIAFSLAFTGGKQFKRNLGKLQSQNVDMRKIIYDNV